MIRKNFISAILVLLFFTLLFGAIYPLATIVVSNLIFPEKSQGSLLKKDGKIIGSKLIGQDFSDPKYLWGRLSATSPYPYNASASSGSNLDWSNKNFSKNVSDRIALLKKFDPDNNNPIPVDLITSSASGLDPEISLDSAFYQASRIAKFRNASKEEIREIIIKNIAEKQLGIFGEKRVNFLLVNLELDRKWK